MIPFHDEHLILAAFSKYFLDKYVSKLLSLAHLSEVIQGQKEGARRMTDWAISGKIAQGALQ